MDRTRYLYVRHSLDILQRFLDFMYSVGHHGVMAYDWEALAEEMRESRLAQGFSMDSLAKAAGVARMSIHSLEKAAARNRIPPTLFKIEKALGWPAGRSVAILEGRSHPQFEVHLSKEVDAEKRARDVIQLAAIATTGNLTADQISELSRRAVADLKAHGLI